MLEGIDDGIGKIRAELAAQKLLENTIFIFSSDNGGESSVCSNAPLRGGKSQLYEGGIRVPLIIQWPDNVPVGRGLVDSTGTRARRSRPVPGRPGLAECLRR
mgnify:CR=1 FL=1